MLFLQFQRVLYIFEENRAVKKFAKFSATYTPLAIYFYALKKQNWKEIARKRKAITFSPRTL